jgi:hypothetical protein
VPIRSSSERNPARARSMDQGSDRMKSKDDMSQIIINEDKTKISMNNL